MDWPDQLITIYLYVCKHYRKKLWIYCQRFSNYADLSCTDEEIITLYLFGIIDERTKIKQIYNDANRHLRAWFPNLPSYTAYVQRLNKVADVFAPLLEIILAEQEVEDNGRVWLTDSFPVVLAKQGHRFQAKVAPELANAGYCASKKLFYYGVRVHVVARRQAGTLPPPEYVGLTGASDHDSKVFEQIRPYLHHHELYADKAYQLPDAKAVENKQALMVRTPVKKQKGQPYLEAANQWLSTAVSQVRQPIESLFAWFESKLTIKCASRVRSYQGLLVQVFGRLAAAMFFGYHLRVCS